MSENPISTPFTSILLVAKDTDKSVELFASSPSKNKFCQFERMELEESVNNLFPVGSILVRDLGDIVSYIAKEKIETIDVLLQNGEKYTWHITSISYVNNAASEMDQSFIAIYFTNSLFKESQSVSFYTERPNSPESTKPLLFLTKYPFVTTYKHLISTYGFKKVFSAASSLGTDTDGNPIVKKGCGVNTFIKNTQEPINYVLFKPRVADATRKEQFQSNILTYLNYLFTYAVNDEGNPYYMFWSDFSGSLNYKYFDLEKDLSFTNLYGFDKPDTDTGQIQVYGIYDSPDQSRTLNIALPSGDIAVQAKKIYVMVTNPAYSYNKKNYYYIRDNPIYMEKRAGDFQGVTASYNELMSPFLSESANTTLTTVTTYTINPSPPIGPVSSLDPRDQNLLFLPDSGFHGYTKDAKDKINTTDALASYENIKNQIDSTPSGLKDIDDGSGIDGTPILAYNDNEYMWQYQFDLTLTHPNIQWTPLNEEVEGNDNEESFTAPTGCGVAEVIDFYTQINTLIDEGLSSSENPQIPDASIFNILNEVSLNKVLKAKYEAMQEDEVYDNEKRLLMEQIEKQNFVSNVLCCIGDEIIPQESWFFAVITGFIKDARKIIKTTSQNSEVWVNSLDSAWLYSWKKLEAGPIINNLQGLSGSSAAYNSVPGGSANHAAYQTMFNAWKLSDCYGSIGMLTENTISDMENGKAFSGMNTWAININERFNKFAGFSGNVDSLNNYHGITTNLTDYLGPGYNNQNLLTHPSYSYRPVGFTGQFYGGETAGEAFQIVQMYKMNVNKLRDMGCAIASSEMSDYDIYYFNVENIIDGAC